MTEPKFVYNHWIPRTIGVAAITLGYTIYCEDSEDKVTNKIRKHELAHIEQIRMLGMPFFYVDYIRQYIINRINGANHADAAWEISYEIDARAASIRRDA